MFFYLYSLIYFKGVFAIFNQSFKKFEADNSKDLILFLMQTMDEELYYFCDNPSLNLSQSNQYDKVNTFMYYMNSYNALNFSIISNIFYGTLNVIYFYIIIKSLNLFPLKYLIMNLKNLIFIMDLKIIQNLKN